MPTASELQELMDWFAKQTPSAPDWFHGIDRVVSTLLVIEIERTKQHEAQADLAARKL